MRLPRIYHPGPLTTGACLRLSDTAGHHLANVLRLSVGQPLLIFNGEGKDYVATITGLKKSKVEVSLGEATVVTNEAQRYVHLGQALARADKMDWIIQKAVELGVKEITPVLTEHCGHRLNKTQLDKKTVHWQAVIISAAEQCGRARLPHLNSALDFSCWLNQVSTSQKLIASLATARPLRQIKISNQQPVTLLIGPEGGFSKAELLLAEQQGFQAFQLGPRVLRTETAALAALSILQSYEEGTPHDE